MLSVRPCASDGGGSVDPPTAVGVGGDEHAELPRACVALTYRAVHAPNVGDPWAFVWAPWAAKTPEPPLTFTMSRGSFERMTRFELATLTLAT